MMQYTYMSILILFILSLLSAIFLFQYFKSEHLLLSDTWASYDYIIIGGGTSGCVLAAKLSANSNKTVLLIEAGGHFNYLSSVPLFAALLQKSKYDWSFKSTRQKFSSFGFNNQIQSLPRGKGLGGSNQINFMVHGDDLSDLNHWQLLGLSNWNQFHTSFNISETKTELGKLFNQARLELNQTNLKHQYGRSTIVNGKRWSTFHYLNKVRDRNNLHILLNSRVTKILFDEQTNAIGVKVIDDDSHEKVIYNKKEIILSAGAFQSPQILLQSGIGAAHLLNQFHIPVIVDLPAVGKNLHDHFNMPLYVSINSSLSITTDKLLNIKEIWNYLLHKQGLFGTSPIGGFIKVDDNVGILLFEMGSTDENVLREIANLKFETFESMFPFYKNTSQEGFVLLTTCLKPSSRGSITIDHTNTPIINPNYLSKYKDIECMIKAVKLANKLINTSVFEKIGAKIHWPLFKNCYLSSSQDIWNDDEYLECIIRTGSMTAHHPGGTCQLELVTDQLFRLKGVNGLRIIDASIFPEPLSTFPNSILSMIAERIADLMNEN